MRRPMIHGALGRLGSGMVKNPLSLCFNFLKYRTATLIVENGGKCIENKRESYTVEFTSVKN